MDVPTYLDEGDREREMVWCRVVLTSYGVSVVVPRRMSKMMMCQFSCSCSSCGSSNVERDREREREREKERKREREKEKEREIRNVYRTHVIVESALASAESIGASSPWLERDAEDTSARTANDVRWLHVH